MTITNTAANTTELVARLAAGYAEPSGYVMEWTPAQWAAFDELRDRRTALGDRFPTAALDRMITKLEAMTEGIESTRWHLAPGALVSLHASGAGGDFEILPAVYLDADTLDATMSGAGWRYAQTRCGAVPFRHLCRLTGREKWSQAWGTLVAEVQLFRVETTAQALPAAHPANRAGTDTFACVTIPGSFHARGVIRVDQLTAD